VFSGCHWPKIHSWFWPKISHATDVKIPKIDFAITADSWDQNKHTLSNMREGTTKDEEIIFYVRTLDAESTKV